MPKITKQTMKAVPKRRAVQDAWDMTDWVSVLLFGASGTGKTTLWATFPDPILAIICSGGGRNPEELKSIDIAAPLVSESNPGEAVHSG